MSYLLAIQVYLYYIYILSISSESLHFSYGHVDCYTENIDIWNSD